MKTLARLILTPILFMMIASVAHGAGSPSSWAETEVDEARGHGLIVSEADDNYQDYITRELFCKLVVQMVEERTGGPVTVSIANPFSDTVNEAIVKAYQMGIVKGVSETEFAPDNLITRQEVAVMMMRASRQLDDMSGTGFASNVDVAGIAFADQTSIASWALDDVKEANKLGIMNGVGDNKINPLGNTTVEQSILLNLRLFNEFGSSGSGVNAAATTTAPTATNNAPELTASAFDYSLDDGTSMTVVGADLASDADGDDLTIESAAFVTGSANGTFTINSQGRLVYAALDRSGHTVGRSILNVVVTDGTDTSETATVTFNINNPNHEPVALEDLAFDVPENTGRNINVNELVETESNGLDFDGDMMTVIGLSSPDSAPVSIINSGSHIAFAGSNIDDESGDSYEVTAEITDGIDTTDVTFIIRELGDSYTPPTLGSDSLSKTYTAGDGLQNIAVTDVIDAGSGRLEIVDFEKQSLTVSVLIDTNPGTLEVRSIPDFHEYFEFTPVSSMDLSTQYATANYDVTVSDGCYSFDFVLSIRVDNPNSLEVVDPGVLITTTSPYTIETLSIDVPQLTTQFTIDPGLIQQP